MFVLVWMLYAVGFGMLILGCLGKKTNSKMIALIGASMLIIGAFTNNAWESGREGSGQSNYQQPNTSISTVVPDATRTRWDLQDTDRFDDSGDLGDYRDQ